MRKNEKKPSRWDNFKKKPNEANENILQAEIVFNRDVFTNIQDKDFILITDFLDNKIVVKATKESTQHDFKNKNFQLSVLKAITDQYNLVPDNSNKVPVKVKKLTLIRDYELDFVELVFKDQFISRRDMLKLNRSLINITVYHGRMLQDEGHSLRIQTLIIKNTIAITGIITKNTKIIYRSLSAKYHILVEISKQMCEFDVCGELFIEKTIKTIKAFFQRITFMHAHHRIAIVLYARMYYPQFTKLEDAYRTTNKMQKELIESNQWKDISANYFAFQIDIHGKIFQDIYHKINIKEVGRDIERVHLLVRKNLFSFLWYINWKKNIPPRAEKIIETANPKEEKLNPREEKGVQTSKISISGGKSHNDMASVSAEMIPTKLSKVSSDKRENDTPRPRKTSEDSSQRKELRDNMFEITSQRL